MSLKNLRNPELIESTKSALKLACEAEVEVLRHFQEIETRKLWTEAGSLYKYLGQTFGLTADQIYPRLQAMRLIVAVPEVEQKLEDGLLSVTVALKAHQAFRAESKERDVSLQEKREVLECLSHASTKDADKYLAEKYPETHKPAEKIKPVAKNQNLIQFYVDDETLAQIDELKAKYSHRMPSGKMEELMKVLIQQANRKPAPRANPIANRPKAKTRSRYISASVTHEMETTRHLGCEFVDESTGQRCGSKHFLQKDHIHEYSKGGLHDVQNLQWLCGFHNRHRFETRRGASCDQVVREIEELPGCDQRR